MTREKSGVKLLSGDKFENAPREPGPATRFTNAMNTPMKFVAKQRKKRRESISAKVHSF